MRLSEYSINSVGQTSNLKVTKHQQIVQENDTAQKKSNATIELAYCLVFPGYGLCPVLSGRTYYITIYYRANAVPLI